MLILEVFTHSVILTCLYREKFLNKVRVFRIPLVRRLDEIRSADQWREY